MKMPGKMLDSRLAAVTKSLPKDDVIQLQGRSCWADIHSEDVFLLYHDAHDYRYPNRPYMCITGECRAIRCDELPFNVNEITFAEGKGIHTEFYYEFSDEELSSMAAKGLFNRGFKCPEIFYNNVFELPVICDFKIVSPSKEGDVPIVFADISKRFDIEINTENCGYTLGDEFEQVKVDDTFMMQSNEVHFDTPEHTVVQISEPEAETVAEPVADKVTDEDKFFADEYQKIAKRVEAHEQSSVVMSELDLSEDNVSETDLPDNLTEEEMAASAPDAEFTDDDEMPFSDNNLNVDYSKSVVDTGVGEQKQVPDSVAGIMKQHKEAERESEFVGEEF